jgi:hypothetical protein
MHYCFGMSTTIWCNLEHSLQNMLVPPTPPPAAVTRIAMYINNIFLVFVKKEAFLLSRNTLFSKFVSRYQSDLSTAASTHILNFQLLLYHNFADVQL